MLVLNISPHFDRDIELGRMAIHHPSHGRGAKPFGFGADIAGAFARLPAQSKSQKGND